MAEIKNKIHQLVMERAKVAPETEFKDSDDLVYDLGMDSLSVVEFIVDLETEFDIEVEEDDIEKIYKYGSLVEYILGKVENN